MQCRNIRMDEIGSDRSESGLARLSCILWGSRVESHTIHTFIHTPCIVGTGFFGGELAGVGRKKNTR